jgi:hypothetical protein
VDLDTIADELYALPPEDFVAARTAWERQARGGGDRDLATRIRQLGKPTTVAWLANQLVREHPEEIEPLLELGAGLREATAALSGDDLRRLSQQQHQVVTALVRQAAHIATGAGHDVTDATVRGLEETLRAALADGELADQLAAGRLTGALQHVGFGLTPGSQAEAAAPRRAREHSGGFATPASAESLAKERQAALLEQLQRDVADAEAAAEAATAADERARAELESAKAAVGKLAGAVSRLQAELDEAVRAHARSERDERKARATAHDADLAARKAERRLEQAAARRASAKRYD